MLYLTEARKVRGIFSMQLLAEIKDLPKGAHDICGRLAIKGIVSSGHFFIFREGQNFPVIIEPPTQECPDGFFRVSYGMGSLESAVSQGQSPVYYSINLDEVVSQLAAKLPKGSNRVTMYVHTDSIGENITGLEYALASKRSFTVKFERVTADHPLGDVGLFHDIGYVYSEKKPEKPLVDKYTLPYDARNLEIGVAVSFMIARDLPDGAQVRKIIAYQKGFSAVTGAKLPFGAEFIEVEFCEPAFDSWDGYIVIAYTVPMVVDPRASC